MRRRGQADERLVQCDFSASGSPDMGAMRSRPGPTRVLNGVIGRIANKRLGIDDQPRLALGGQNVLNMQVGAEQLRAMGVVGQFSQKLNRGTRETSCWASRWRQPTLSTSASGRITGATQPH